MKGHTHSSPSDRRGVTAWFARNHVAANILMLAIVGVGLVVAGRIRQEVFPVFALDTVNVRMQYRGASPEEVERSIILPIESEVRALDLVRKVTSIATEGQGYVSVEIRSGFDRNRALQDVTAAVQRISLFPDEAELPVISLGGGWRRSVVSLAVYGDLDERTLVDYAQQLEDGLLAEPEISVVEMRGVRQPEIQIEIPQATLRSLGLTLDDVARAIDASALDVPAGTLRTSGGEIMLRTTERRDFASQFAEIFVLSSTDGAKVRLSDIATVRDDFEESEREGYFNGKRAVFLSVFSSENQAPLEVAAAVRKFLDREQPNLPSSVNITVSRDSSQSYQERLELLLVNGSMGLLLVLLALGLFLELRVAVWTAIGIPVSILGSLILLPFMDASINMISLFGFIVTLGIVVDDAIVVGEDIFHKFSTGMSRMEAAVAGAKEMFVPVVFAVSTNVIAFLPLLFVPGTAGRFFKVLPSVVIAVFTVSLVECLLVLPSHLAFSRKNPHRDSWFARFDRKQTAMRLKLDAAVEHVYQPVLESALRHRYLTIAIFVTLLILVGAFVRSGRIDFAFRPTIETEFIQAEIGLPSGTPVDRTREVAFQIEAAARRTLEQVGEGDILVGIFTAVADRGSNRGEVAVTLVPQSQRTITSEEFANRWREEIGVIPDIESLFFDYLIGPGGEAEIEIELAHPEVATLRRAATDVAAAIARYPGVEDVNKGYGREMPQFNFEIKPEGRSLGITARELGQQIRHSFYGAEALRQPRGRDELRVMVKLPEADRRSMSGLEELLIHAPNGGEIPLSEAAVITPTNAPVRIERVDGSRVLDVTGNVIPGVNNGNRVLAAFQKNDLPAILAAYPGLRYSFEGDQREQREAIEGLSWGLLAALFAIYAIMASLLRAYMQAFIVLMTIPWSLAGAVVGHVLLGFDLSIFSVFGMIALCGMVVNGGFVMAMTRRRLLDKGEAPERVTLLAALRRFRPILLTSLTTFFGLMPMIFERSIQALFLVPMAISLGVGTLVSSFVILFLVPSAFKVLEDWQGHPAVEPEEMLASAAEPGAAPPAQG